MSQVIIELARIGKPPRIYREGFLSDNGVELRTLTVFSHEASRKFSSGWQKAGCFPTNRFASAVRKILFYHEYFAISQLLDSEKHSLGCYVDIATPMQKFDEVYRLTDLLLDLWIPPDGGYQELDVDEFEEAVASGKLTPEWEANARQTFAKLKTEILTGDFPTRYTEI
jgi:hypothetical protein